MKRLKSPILLLAVLSLSACVTQPIQQSPAALRQSHGFVHVTVPHAIGVISPSVTLRSTTSGAEFSLSQTVPGSASLGLWIPAGSYEISEMVGREKGSYAPIMVESGKLTDLGGLTWASVGGTERVLLPLRHPDLEVPVAAAMTSLKEHVSKEKIEWRPSAPPKPQAIPDTITGLGLIADLLTAYTNEVNKPPLRSQLRKAGNLNDFTQIALSSAAPLLGEPAFDASGALYIGSNYGQLRKREPDGSWRALNAGTLSPLTAVESSGQRIVVGTHDGSIHATEDGGLTWKRMHQFGPGEAVVSLQVASGRYLVLTARFTAQTTGPQATVESLQIYAIDGPGAQEPKLIRRINLPSKVDAFGLQALRGSVGGKYYFVNTLDSVERLDLETLTWKKVGPTHTVTHLRIANGANGGSTITAFKAQGAFSKLSVSTDFGESWLPLDTPPYAVHDVRMENLNAGTASRWDTGAFAVAFQFLQYEQATKSWRKTWTTPQSACTRTIRDASGFERFCVSGGGSVFRIAADKLVPEFLAN